MDQEYLTSGQVARKLRISISTLKRWLDEVDLDISKVHNHNGWRLFTEEDIAVIREHKRRIKRDGKRFKSRTLKPVIISAEKQFG